MTRAAQWLWQAVDGLKTLGVALVMVLLGLGDWYDVVPISPLLTYYLGTDKAAFLMILLPVVFGTLRFVTDGPLKWKRGNEVEPF